MIWHTTLLFVDHKCVGSIHQNRTTQMWHTLHLRWVRENLDPRDTPCKTEEGAKRRIERYVRIWLVAGKPEPEPYL
jgi:hypothetical protein